MNEKAVTDRALERHRILIVEDEYFLADELQQELADEGAVILGPASSVRNALDVLDSADAVDGAVLDVNLGGELAFPVADVLIDRGVPIIFTTGYDGVALPERFRHLPLCEKPVNVGRITAALGKALRA